MSQNGASQLHPARMLQPEVLHHCKTHGCSRAIMHGGEICVKACSCTGMLPAENGGFQESQHGFSTAHNSRVRGQDGEVKPHGWFLPTALCPCSVLVGSLHIPPHAQTSGSPEPCPCFSCPKSFSCPHPTPFPHRCIHLMATDRGHQGRYEMMAVAMHQHTQNPRQPPPHRSTPSAGTGVTGRPNSPPFTPKPHSHVRPSCCFPFFFLLPQS